MTIATQFNIFLGEHTICVKTYALICHVSLRNELCGAGIIAYVFRCVAMMAAHFFILRRNNDEDVENNLI